MVIKTSEILAQMGRMGISEKALADKLHVSPYMLGKKISNASGAYLTVKEANQIVKILKFPREVITDIFFA